MFKRSTITAVLLATILTGCGTTYSPAVSPVSIDSTVTGPVAGIGIEGHHIIDMTREMIASMLNDADLSNQPVPPRIIVDGSEFQNLGTQRIDKDIIANRLRVHLNKAARGSLQFVGEHYSRSIEYQRAKKRDGSYDTGTLGLSKKRAGADFKLGGTIQTLTSRSAATGMNQRYNLITFELFDVERGMIVWNDAYEFSAASADDVIYR